MRRTTPDVAHLLARYSKDLTNHWAVRPALFEAFDRGLGVRSERFASPLNVCETTAVYHSFYEEDEAFGAIHDAYSSPFLTSSEVNPEYTLEQLAKAMRTAVESTYNEEFPQTHLLVYPVWQGEPYIKWLRHPRVHRLCRIPQRTFDFTPPTAYTGIKQTRSRKSTKWDIDILLVANPLGLAQRYGHDLVSAHFAEKLRELTGRDIEILPPPAAHVAGRAGAAEGPG